MRHLLSKFLTQASMRSFVPGRRQFSRYPTLFLSKRTEDDEGSAESIAKSKIAKAREYLPNRYKVFDDKDTEIIFDESINLDVILNQKQKKLERKPLDKKNVTGLRGQRGVFDIEELVILLKEENMSDIATIKVPKEMKYCEYMVLCTATSPRHIKAFIEALNLLYKIKKHTNDPFLALNDASKDWRLVDMSNIILHVFLRETRELYDIETLWTVGEQFDDKIQRPDTNIVQDIMDKHISFLQQQSMKNVES